MLDQLSDRKLEFMHDVTAAIIPLTELQEEKALELIGYARRISALSPESILLLEKFIADLEVGS